MLWIEEMSHIGHGIGASTPVSRKGWDIYHALIDEIKGGNDE